MIDMEIFDCGVFVWEDTDGELNIGISDNIKENPIYVMALLTDALKNVMIDLVEQNPTTH